MARNNGILYNKSHPVGYTKFSLINTGRFFALRNLRIVNEGKNHVVFQIESKHGHFGIERTAKIIRKKGRNYFVFKNKKYFA